MLGWFSKLFFYVIPNLSKSLNVNVVSANIYQS